MTSSEDFFDIKEIYLILRRIYEMTVTDQDRMVCGVHLSEDERSVIILDQTQLPNRQVWLTLNTSEELCDAIRRLSVRGAPAIGICAGYGIYVLAQQIRKGLHSAQPLQSSAPDPGRSPEYNRAACH